MNPMAEGTSGSKSDLAPGALRSTYGRRAGKKGASAPLWGREILDRLVQGLAEAPVFLTDAQGAVTSISPAIERVLGYSPVEVIGRPATKFGIGSDAELKDILEQLVICGQIAGVKMTIGAKTGEKIRCKLAATVVKDSRNRVAGIVGNLYDFMGLDEQVELIVKNDDRSSTAYESDSTASIWIDIDNRIVRWSDGAKAIFGYIENEILGCRLSKLIPDRRIRFRIANSMSDSLHIGNSFFSQVILAADQDNCGLRLETAWRFLRDETNKTIGREILIRNSEQLPGPQSAESARVLPSVARQAAAKIAHEVKNPLSSIYLNVEMLGEQIKSIPDEEIKNEAFELVSSVIGEVEHLKDLTQGYLKQAIVSHTIFCRQSLHELLSQLQRFMQKEMEFHNIEFVNEFYPEMPMVCCDRDRLKEAIMNLYANSADAIPDGGKIHTITRISDGWAEILISDTGPGISDQDIDSLFLPFFTTKTSGTGLGLAIVEEILSEHEGSVEVCQDPDDGTFFLLRLPLHC
jgi:PAS domain S-box-containing protein